MVRLTAIDKFFSLQINTYGDRMMNLSNIKDFGRVEAEDDTVLDYFLETNIIKNIDSGGIFLVLGRKGSGKTAIFRYFTESKHKNISTALNLNGYPWRVHEKIRDEGSEDVESYVASWKYLIAVEYSKMIISKTDRPQMKEVLELIKFINKNYGTNKPSLNDIFTPKELKISGDLEPEILGVKLGKISFTRENRQQPLGQDLNALTEKLFDYIVKIAKVSSVIKLTLHFDELDRGMSTLESSRKNMIIGLVLACKETNVYLKKSLFGFKSIIYLRMDIWEQLKFSDKNKISQSNADLIEWDDEQLINLISIRIKALLGSNYEWADIDDGKKINKQSKLKHIIDRTFMRPRDVISFLNNLLDTTKKNQPLKLRFENKDITNARPKYSNYLRDELDDEISPHWSDWDICLRVLSRIGKLYFIKEEYSIAYNEINRSLRMTKSETESLEGLYNYGIISYESRSGYGGSGWKSKFANPELGWDPNAAKFKVHLGLKEFMKLKEERSRK